jgi:hypothetical protein
MRTGRWLRRARSAVTPPEVMRRVPVSFRKCRQIVSGWCRVAGQSAGEQAVEVAGHDGEGGVEIDVERDGR